MLIMDSMKILKIVSGEIKCIFNLDIGPLSVLGKEVILNIILTELELE